MYDMSKQFERFIKDFVILQGDKQQDLRDKKENLPEKSIIPFELIIRESTKARI